MERLSVPSRLNAILESGEFEDLGWIQIAAASWTEDEAELHLRIHTGVDERPAKTWQIRARDICASRVTRDIAYGVTLADDHPVLLAVRSPWVTLSFKGHAVHPDAMVGQLWQCHDELAEGWLAFLEFFNTELSLTKLLQSGGGVLAEGPKPLLSSYGDVLERGGLSSVMHGERPPTRRDRL